MSCGSTVPKHSTHVPIPSVSPSLFRGGVGGVIGPHSPCIDMTMNAPGYKPVIGTTNILSSHWGGGDSLHRDRGSRSRAKLRRSTEELVHKEIYKWPLAVTLGKNDTRITWREESMQGEGDNREWLDHRRQTWGTNNEGTRGGGWGVGGGG